MEMITTLIVEDDVKIAEIQRIFTEKIAGYTVVGIAHSIAEAEEMVRVLEPDLVLLDIFFPDGSGIDLLWKIRTNMKKTDVVLITAAKEVAFFKEALRGGVFDYILKPLAFNRFEQTLNTFKRQRQKLNTISTISQKKVDRLLHQENKSVADNAEMPKGIDPITLKKVERIFDSFGEDDGISAERAGSLIGVSRTTSRRYLEYLVAGGVVTADLCYRAQGRPERLYRKKV